MDFQKHSLTIDSLMTLGIHCCIHLMASLLASSNNTSLVGAQWLPNEWYRVLLEVTRDAKRQTGSHLPTKTELEFFMRSWVHVGLETRLSRVNGSFASSGMTGCRGCEPTSDNRVPRRSYVKLSHTWNPPTALCTWRNKGAQGLTVG